MWPHRRFSQNSKTDAGVNESKRRRQQSVGRHGWNLKGLPSRACCSLPAQRKMSHSNMRAPKNGFRIETQENNFPKWGTFDQSQDDNADEQNRFIDLTSSSFSHHRSPLKEITKYCGDPVFKKYSPDKSESSTGIFDSSGFMEEKHQSSNSYSFTKQGCHKGIKKFGSDTDSPTSSELSCCFELPKFSDTPNNFFTFSEVPRTFPNPSESSRKNLNYFNFSTPAVENHQSKGDMNWHSMNQIENLPSSLLSPYSPRLQGGCSPPESVYEGTTVNEDLSDEDVDTPPVQALSPPRFNSYTEEVPFFTSISTSCNKRLKKLSMMPLQPCTADPDEEYKKLMSEFRSPAP